MLANSNPFSKKCQ